MQTQNDNSIQDQDGNSTKPVLKAVFENIFLIPILPYHLVLFIWVNYLAFKDNDLIDVAMTGDIKKNETFDNFCRKYDDKLLPTKYAISFLVWLYVIL